MAVDKLVDSTQLNTDLTSVANAIRAKSGGSSQLAFPSGFVSAVQSIPTGGGSTLIQKTITTNGTYSAQNDNADGYSSVSVNVRSPYVSGTFTGSTAGEKLTVSIPYTGNGYPVAVMIYPEEGSYNANGSFYSKIDYRATVTYVAVKNEPNTVPSYIGSGTNDKAMVLLCNKNSESDATTTTSNKNNSANIYNPNSASPYSSDLLRLNSATAMSVVMSNGSYGFSPNVTYRYHVLYSEA